MAGSTHPSRSPGTPGDPSRPRDAENCASAVTKTPRTSRLFRRCIHVTMVMGPYRAPNPCSASGVLWKTHEPCAVPPQTLASRASRGGHSLPGPPRAARDGPTPAARAGTLTAVLPAEASAVRQCPEGDHRELDGRGGDHEGVEDLVVAEDRRVRVGTLGRVDDGPRRV